MNDNEKQLKEILEVLEKEGILKNIILIGSWCQLFYKNIFENFRSTIKTIDVDLFVPNPKSVTEKNGIISEFKNINYDIKQDIITNKTIFISDEGFRIEFLTILNRDHLTCVRLGSTGIYAESISSLDMYVGNYIEVNYYGIQVKVASPASYVLQKLLINNKRGEKAEKDIQSVKIVLWYIITSKKYLNELNSLYLSLPKKWKKTIKENAKKNDIDLFD